MSNITIYRFALDMTPGGVTPVVHLSQYDEAFQLEFTLYSRSGELDIPSGATAMIEGTKLDGKAYSANATISGNVVTVAGDVQISAVAGNNPFQIVLKSGNSTVGSANFTIAVERAAMDYDTVSDSKLAQIQDVTATAAQLTAAAENVTDGVETFEALAESVSDMLADITDDTLSITDKAADAAAVGNALAAEIAPKYSTTGTYEVGDYVLYNNALYRCNTAIATAESWTAAHWTAVKVGSELSDLKSDLKQIINDSNLFENPVDFIPNAYYDTAIHTTTNKDVYILSLLADTEYTFRGVRLISSAGTLIENIMSSGYLHTFTPSASGNYYITVDTTDAIHFFVTTTIYYSGIYGTNEEPVFAERLVLQNTGNSKTATMSQNAITGEIETVYDSLVVDVNMANPSTFTENKFMGKDGSIGSSSSYFFTDYIPVDGLDSISFTNARFLTAFNAQKTVMPDDGVDSASIGATTYTIPSGVAYVIITGETTNINKYMVNSGSVLSEFVPYSIKDLADNIFTKTKANIGMSACGATELLKTATELNSGSDCLINNAPQNLKNGVILSAYCEFDSFNSVVIGKGFNAYRGDWFDIDGTNVVMKHYEQSQQTVLTQAHNITISNYIQIFADFRSNGKVYVTVNSTGGSSRLEFDHTFEQNGVPILFGRQQIRNIKFNVVSSKAKCPLWIIGDSYLGFSDDRVMGQLHALGYTDNILVDGLAGQGSANAYREFLNLIGGGNIPKYLIWYIGMNDTDAVYEEYLEKVASVCDDYGITLIINDVPTVPAVNNEAKHTLVSAYASSGYRIVDSYTAVGATSSGVWRTGFLSSDNVHPTALGAKALAVALLNSVPEIGGYAI